MKKQTTINLPKPCGEKWDEMLPAQSGRHCQSCAVTVTDFTKMSDAELLAFLKNNPGKSCGRFTPSQINRPLVADKSNGNPYFFRLAAAVSVFLGLSGLAQPANAQTPTIAYEQSPGTGKKGVEKQESKENSLQDSVYVLEGVVTDKADGSGLFAVNVGIIGTQTGAITDIDGRFMIKTSTIKGILAVTYVGYESLEIPFDFEKGKVGKTNIEMNEAKLELELVNDIAGGFEIDHRSRLLPYKITSLAHNFLNRHFIPALNPALPKRAAEYVRGLAQTFVNRL